jgi:hypothetical protein
VYLQHGLLDSACTWILNGRSDSLGFVLADAKYDVWIGKDVGLNLFLLLIATKRKPTWKSLLGPNGGWWRLQVGLFDGSNGRI